MKRNEGSDGTFRTVRGRYQDWFGAGDRGALPGRAVADDYDQPDTGTGGGEMGKMILMGIGGGIGVVLLALSALSFATAAKWGEIARDGAATGYSAVGFFLLVAGAGAIVSTWNHLFRATRAPAHH